MQPFPQIGWGRIANEISITYIESLGDDVTNVQEAIEALARGLRFDPVLDDAVNADGQTPLQWAMNFESNLHNAGIGDWNTVFRHMIWVFRESGTGHTFGPIGPFASKPDLAEAIGENATLTGGLLQDSLLFTCYDAVDESDSFSRLRRARNSLFATMRGAGGYSRGVQYGLSGNFLTSGYYLNWTADLASRMINKHTGFMPGSENDGVIWYARGRRSLWNWPKVGNAVILDVGVGQRGAAWNTATNTYTTPAPMGTYTIETPFVLTEQGRQRTLAFNDVDEVGLHARLLHAVSVMVFPVTNGNHVAFLVKPYGFDNFWTDRVDTGVDALFARIRHRHEFTSKYVRLSTQGEDENRSMYHPFEGGTNIFFPPETAMFGNIDQDKIPVAVDIARRNIPSGIRSPWRQVGVVRRRIPNAAIRFDPAWK